MQTRPTMHIPSLLYLILSASGVVISLTSAGVLFLSGMLTRISGGNNDVVYTNFALGWILVLVVLLLVPGVYYSVNRLRHKPAPGFNFSGIAWPWIAVGAWLVLYLLGVLAAGKNTLNWLVIPPLTTALVSIPLVLWLRLGSKGSREVSRQAAWSVLGTSLMVTPALIMLLEIIILLLLGGVVMFFLVISPDRLQQLEALIKQIAGSNMDPVLLLRIVQPVLQNPWVLFALVSVTSVIIPLLEEFFKPLWVWMFVKNITPARGFFYGMICGAAFALLESLGYLASPLGEAWPALLVGRVATGILHTGTSGLVGWGLASAWSDRKYTRLALAYFLAVLLHGLWNTFGLLMGLAEYLQPVNQLNVILSRLGGIAPLTLGVLSICLAGILIAARKALRPETASGVETEDSNETVRKQPVENE